MESDVRKSNYDNAFPVAAAAMVAQVVQLASKRAANVTESFVPDRNETYVAFGFYNDLRDIIKSRIFYPIYITGLSGNGKTMMIEQVCAFLKRELIRVNITKRTDESDLIGSYELVDGNTIRREGPVITAMRRGAVLLLDECDLGTEDILCLQPILEGKPYFDKKTGEVVHPAAGFNVIATANTKGKGSDDGRFIGTNLLNEAFLERFAITVEQEYPPANTERKILEKNFAVLNITDTTFIDRLITWAEVIRKSFADGAVDEVISTRRLVHISKAFSIFNNRLKAIEMCLNRFDADTKTAFLDLYTKVDAEATPAKPEVTANTDELFMVKDANTGDTTFRYKNETVVFSEQEMIELLDRGLSAEQIKMRVITTLEKVAANKSNAPF
jgi:MoxR-like ATPase